MRVIIGDDLFFQLQGLETMLSRLGFTEIDKATNAVEIVRLHKIRRHELVLIDIRGMDSYYQELKININTFDAIRLIKDWRPESKVIVVTSTPEMKYITSALRANTDEILIKGFDLNKLKDIIEKVFNKKISDLTDS